ncbi:MAG: hypothetical protein MI724_19825 [Spirochaetales bacterium]|nr:hypothetical protein [Spirochaetales bacterium]
MKSIHIRNIDPVVLQKLKMLANLHRRSLQGELLVILEEAARRAPSHDTVQPLELITVHTGNTDPWTRDALYGDDGR